MSHDPTRSQRLHQILTEYRAAIDAGEHPDRQALLRQHPDLAAYHLVSASQADLLRRQRRFDEASAAYRRALALVTNPAERRYLERRLAESEAAAAAEGANR